MAKQLQSSEHGWIGDAAAVAVWRRGHRHGAVDRRRLIGFRGLSPMLKRPDADLDHLRGDDDARRFGPVRLSLCHGRTMSCAHSGRKGLHRPVAATDGILPALLQAGFVDVHQVARAPNRVDRDVRAAFGQQPAQAVDIDLDRVR